jgi:Arc/MetJ-type ribon-helix-helix transcriptional regulator
MTTISVPLPADLLLALEHLVEQGVASNKADAIRKALRKYLEDRAVQDVLDAHNEPTLYGDLDELAKKIV